MEPVLNPHLVDDKELLQTPISNDAQETLNGFPDFSDLPIEVSENGSSRLHITLMYFLQMADHFPLCWNLKNGQKDVQRFEEFPTEKPLLIFN